MIAMTFDKTSNEPYVLFRSDLNFAHISAGRIPVRIFKECSEQIALSLCALFNYSLCIGRFSSDSESAHVTPVHKKESSGTS